MASLAPRTRKTLEELEALMGSAAIPPRVARSCEHLVERLRRPIRVGLIGFETGLRKRLLSALLGTEVLPERMAWPTIEIGFAEKPHTKATLADASTLSADGMPRSDLLDRDAVFLEVGAPIDALRRVTLLHLAASEDAEEQSAALCWAARRIDFALWCTRDFSPPEARIWSAAAPELKNHAYLVAFASEPDDHGLRGRTPPGFERVMFLPTGNAMRCGAKDLQVGANRLFEQLASDIDDALGEDLDAARVLLFRCGRRVGASEPEPAALETPRPSPAEEDALDIPETAELVDLLSEPLIFLKRQARDLFEALEWHDAVSADWAGEVLERCREVTDGLRDRAAEWPEDVGPVSALRGLVDDASDMATLLQIEGGAEQAEDAAALLLQIRSAFEASLARTATPVN
ncbi:hypothetical protein DEA8626_01771 [Defluviimonas aquaemixtae]|uniref:Dynamin family protein n=1 Tax=Albidovulum aquaemixtae TaxID=1542388 RepID=A0A2R8B6K0_9RHOB|nr:hypothetical protein [Defluviimonas aquaemixtae]SPH18239.1 hypothetical protein DEA8626_01771 [Defluviimonas aquaemixtae]